MIRLRKLPTLLSLAGLYCSPSLHAASFDIANGVTLTAQQTLNANETGVNRAGGVLSVAGVAIVAPGDNVTVSNSGTLTTTVGFSHGIYSTGANATISNSGLIATTGFGAHGIYSALGATNATISNSGSIATTGFNGIGIYSLAANATISNSGTLTTTGGSAFGIYSGRANATISNSGSIATTGDSAYGIDSEGTNATISNSGSITTTGNSAHGIYSALGATNATISNSGSIATTGWGGVGIYSALGANATISNSGSITTTGSFGYGIGSTGASATISNSGSIATAGNTAFGIASGGTNATISNSGSISVTGVDSAGIVSVGANSTINLSGRVSATGAATQAIAGGNNQTLNLLPGAAVIGAIDLGAGTNHVNVALNRGSPSATMSITNPGTITQSGKGLSFVNGNTVSIVDTTGLTANQAALGSASSTIFQAVNQQLNQGTPAPQPIKVASNELTPGMLHQDPGPAAWGHAFGGQSNRDGSGAALGYKDNGYGLIGGYEQTLGEHRVGVFGGVSRSTVKTDTASINTDSHSLFLGVYGQYASDDWRVNGSLATGYVSDDSKRLVVDNLSGNETAQSDYHSTYISPSIAVIRIFDLGAGVSLRPSAQLNYTYGRVSGYDEKGTTRSNLSVGSHNASVLNSRVQVAARQELADHQGEFEVRVGASQSLYGNDKVKMSLQGSAATNYGITGADSISGGYVGMGGRIALKNQLSLVGDVEYTQGSNDNHSTVAYLGMAYRF